VDYKATQDFCEQVAAASKRAVDNGILAWMDERHPREAKAFFHAVQTYIKRGVKLDEPALHTLFVTYQGWQAFRPGGLVTKYVKTADYARFTGQERAVLERYEMVPWSFRLLHVVAAHSHDMLTVLDVLSGEEIPLYSKGISEGHAESGPRLWMVLVSHNGRCAQTYGALMSFPAYDVEDFYYFGSELGVSLDGPAALSRLINRQPIPFLMLYMVSDIPRVRLGGEVDFVWQQSVDAIEDFAVSQLEPRFTMAWNRNVFRAVPAPVAGADWGAFPHKAQAYYHERSGELLRIAQTEAGFEALTAALADCGIVLDDLSEVAVSMGMVVAATRVTGKKFRLDPYESLFEVKQPDSSGLDVVNMALRLMMDDVNAGTVPDFEAVARETGLDVEEVENIYRQISGILDRR
jgi:hypothetical protein